MAITMKELLASQQKLKTEDAKSAGGQEHISIAEFRKMMGEAQGAADQQTGAINRMDSTLKEGNSVQMGMKAEQAKAAAATKELNDSTIAALDKMHESLKKGFGETKSSAADTLNANIKKVGKELEKQTKSLDGIYKFNSETSGKAKSALEEPGRKSFGEKLKGMLQQFTPTGILRSIEKKAGTGLFGGILGNIAGRAADVRERASDIKNLDPELFKKLGAGGVKKMARTQVDQLETSKRANRETESKISGILSRNPNLSEEDLASFQGGRALLQERDKNVAGLGLGRIANKKPKEDEEKEATAEKESGALAFSDETQIESQRELTQQTGLLQKIEENTRPMKGKEETNNEKTKKGEDEGGGILDTIKDMALGKMGLKGAGKMLGGAKSLAGGALRSGASAVGRFAMSAAGGTVATAVGAGLVGGYLGHKFKKHVEKKEAENLAADEKEISSNKLDTEVLKKLPDAGEAWKPGDLNTVARQTNLAELRIKNKQRFSEEEASLIKQKLDVMVPAELIGAAVQAGAEAAAPGPAKTNTAERTREDYDAELAKQKKKWGVDDKRLAELNAKAGPDGSGLTKEERHEQMMMNEGNLAAKRGTALALKMGGRAPSELPSASAAVTPPAPSDANAVYNKSATNAEAASVNNGVAPPVIINAPNNVNNSSKQNITMPQPIRNGDSAVTNYIKTREAFF